MASVIKEGNGFLSPNQKHVKGDRLPCLTGHATINGIDYKVSLWAPKPDKKAYFMTIQKIEGPQEAQPKTSVAVETPPAEPSIPKIEQETMKLTNCDF